MRVALVVTNSKGKSLSFATNTLEKFSLKKLLVLVEKGRVELLHRVQSKWGIYVRSNPNDTSDDNLDSRSVSYHKLIKAKDDLEIIIGEPSFRLYWKHYSAYLKHVQKTEEVITVDGYLWTPKRFVVAKISKHKNIILKAAARFSIDPNTQRIASIKLRERTSTSTSFSQSTISTLQRLSSGNASTSGHRASISQTGQI